MDTSAIGGSVQTVPVHPAVMILLLPSSVPELTRSTEGGYSSVLGACAAVLMVNSSILLPRRRPIL